MRSSDAISTSHDSLAAAEKDGAAKYAKYEYFKALAFLKEAKLRKGYGEYEAAENYAEQANKLAKQSQQTAKSRRDLELRRVRGKLLKHKLGRKVLQRIHKDRLKQKAKDKARKNALKDPRNSDSKDKSSQPTKKKVRKTTKSSGKVKRRTFKPPIMLKPGTSKESR